MKFDSKVVHELCQEAFRNLGIPLDPKKTTNEQSNEVFFILALSECISMASSFNITSERRKAIMAEIIRMDEAIAKKAAEIVKNAVDSRNN